MVRFCLVRFLPTPLLLLLSLAGATPVLADVKVEDPDFYYQAARDYMRDEKWNLAVEQLEKSLAIKNDDFRVWVDLGDALCVDARGVRYGTPERNERAAGAYRRATELNPGSARAWNNLAWLRAKTKTSMDEALAAAKRAIEIDDGRAGYQDTLAEVYFVRGEYPLAMRAIRRALEIEPGSDYYTKQLQRFQDASENAVEPTPTPKATPKKTTKKPAGKSR